MRRLARARNETDVLRAHRNPNRRVGLGIDLSPHAEAAQSGAVNRTRGSADAALEQIDVADEVRHPARIRLLVDFGRRCHLHQAAAIHHRDPVGHRHCFALVVGDDNEGEPEPALQIHQLELRRATEFFIERGHRLVEQQHARPLDQRARQRDALALAA